jgi:hypothetical protein
MTLLHMILDAAAGCYIEESPSLSILLRGICKGELSYEERCPSVRPTFTRVASPTAGCFIFFNDRRFITQSLSNISDLYTTKMHTSLKKRYTQPSNSLKVKTQNTYHFEQS